MQWRSWPFAKGLLTIKDGVLYFSCFQKLKLWWFCNLDQSLHISDNISKIYFIFGSVFVYFWQQFSNIFVPISERMKVWSGCFGRPEGSESGLHSLVTKVSLKNANPLFKQNFTYTYTRSSQKSVKKASLFIILHWLRKLGQT